MSETESQFDDEDLSAPPKKATKSKPLPKAANRRSLNVNRDDEDTMDEELEQTSPAATRTSVKRKRDNVSREIPASTTSRRDKNDGIYFPTN